MFVILKEKEVIFMKKTRLFSIFLALCLLLTACGASSPMDGGDYYRDDSSNGAEMGWAEAPAETVASMDLTGNSLSSPAQADRKLIKTVSIEAETETYDELIPALDAKIISLGGYVESRETGSYSRTRRWTTMTIRIPADSLSDFVTHVSENANVLSTSEQTEDVTLQYADTEAKITALKTEQNRLLELLAAANNLSEILEIEARLSDVTYELERYESQKRSYDNRIVYATITLQIQEVQVLTQVEEPTVWSRIRDGFMDSLESVSDGFVDLFVLVIAGSPYLVVFGAILALIIVIARKQSRKPKKTQPAPPPENP